MRRYFDAFVYFANWGSCRLALRVAQSTFSKTGLKPFKAEYALSINDSGSHWIIDWTLNESDERINMEGGGWMGRLIPLRDELLRGDLRPLYLGWLAGVSAGEVDDENAIEPPVPQGMAQLSGAQQALAEFLEIDPDLLAASAMGSPALAELGSDGSIDMWLTTLPVDEMRVILKLLLESKSQQAERQLKSRFLAWQKEHAQGVASGTQRRVSELHALAEEQEVLRMQRETKERAREQAKARKKREAYLMTVAADFDRCWHAADQSAERGNASGYDGAKQTIVDLADAYALVSKQTDFDQVLRRFMERHGKRGALLRRLIDAGLWKK